ncbi:MAG: hypothetical protein JRI75_11055 [Deltaproteobacteria bacterium]|nr:hypothetical protein [Deltaproteobacteria bacterium]
MTGTAIRTGTIVEEIENIEKPFDEKKISKTLASLVGHPVTDFIEKWGYPDTIYRIYDGTFEYLFVIEINPSFSLDVYFKTNPVGKIVEYRSEERIISSAAQNDVNPEF